MLHDFILDDDNYQLFAAKAYQKSAVLSTEEFLNDLKALERLKSDITRWGNDKEDTQLRLIINKIVTFCNIFGQVNTLKMLFWKNRKDPNTTNFLLTLVVFIGLGTTYKLIVSKNIILDFTKFNINKDLQKSLEEIFK